MFSPARLRARWVVALRRLRLGLVVHVTVLLVTMVLVAMGGLLALSSSVSPVALAQTSTQLRAVLSSRVGDLTKLQVPSTEADLPQPVDPKFRITSEKSYLGRLLFFDPVRSNHVLPEFGGVPETSQTASCATCHMGEAATKAGMAVAIALGGEGRHVMTRDGTKTVQRTEIAGLEDLLPTGMVLRNELGEILLHGNHDPIDSPGRVSPSVIGFAFNNRLLWGGEAGEANPEGYPAQEDIVRIASSAHRMANPDTSHLQAIPAYQKLFADAFPDENAEYLASGDLTKLINLDTQFRAIASFLRTVITRDTPWDRFLAGDNAALTAQERRGAFLFAASTTEGGANCIACHSGPALNKQLGDEEGLLVEENFHNLGLQEHPKFDLARAAFGDPSIHDVGRAGVTGDPGDRFEFKSPTLRQLRDAAPYFHSGEAATLRDVVEYFNAGVPSSSLSGSEPSLSPLFTSPRGAGTTGLGLSATDVDALVAFLDGALYDSGLVTDDPSSPTRVFELTMADLTYDAELTALGAQDGWLPSGMPNGVADELSRSQTIFVRGSTGNGDNRVDLADAIYLLAYLFRGGPAPAPMVAADINDDGRVDIGDPVYLVVFLFRGGVQPPFPFPDSGQDLTF